MNKSKIKIGLLVSAALISISILCACHEKITDIQNVYIEVLSSDEMSVEKIVLDKEDAIRLKDIISQTEVESDRGFVFAEGGYRIVVETEEERLYLYPYCGIAATIRVGNDGHNYLWVDEKLEEELQTILDKYNFDREGIWSWDKIDG